VALTLRELIEESPECLDCEIYVVTHGGYYNQTDIFVEEVCESSLNGDDDCSGECEECENPKQKVIVVSAD